MTLSPLPPQLSSPFSSTATLATVQLHDGLMPLSRHAFADAIVSLIIFFAISITLILILLFSYAISTLFLGYFHITPLAIFHYADDYAID